MLGTASLADFQDFLLLCGPFPFSQRNDENRQSVKPRGAGPGKAPQLRPLLQTAWDCWSHTTSTTPQLGVAHLPFHFPFVFSQSVF